MYEKPSRKCVGFFFIYFSLFHHDCARFLRRGNKRCGAVERSRRRVLAAGPYCLELLVHTWWAARYISLIFAQLTELARSRS